MTPVALAAQPMKEIPQQGPQQRVVALRHPLHFELLKTIWAPRGRGRHVVVSCAESEMRPLRAAVDPLLLLLPRRHLHRR